MDRQRVLRKSRKSGLGFWRKGKGKWGSIQMSPILEEELSPSEIIKKVQDILQEHDENKKGVLTRADIQKLKEEDLPWSTEELHLLFDGLDSDSQGFLTIQEFIAGLRHVLISQTVTRQQRKRKVVSLKAPTHLSLEEADSEQQKSFEAFMSQLGDGSIFEDRSELWTIWMQLQQDEPHLLGSLKEFLAKMTRLIKDAKHAKEKLRLILNTRVADHNKEVQRLCEEMEQQIERERRRLQRESEIRSHFYNMEMQKGLDVKEREIWHFLGVQKELEKEICSLREKQHKANTKNQQLKQTKVALENQLHQALHQLQETQRHLDAMKNRVSQLFKESGRDGLLEEGSSKTPQTPQVLPCSAPYTSLSGSAATSASLGVPVDENEVVASELEMNYEYRLTEDTQDHSAQQQAPEDNASITKTESEPRTRLISIEENPLAEFIEEQQPFLEKLSGQSSLHRELNDAIAASSRVSESHQQQMHAFGFQGQGSNQMRQDANNQHYVSQAKIPQYEALLKNDGPGRRILETQQGTLQRESCMQGDVVGMKKTNIFEPRVDLNAQVPIQRGSVFPEVCSPGHSELASQVSDTKESPEQDDMTSLGKITQPENHKQVLNMRIRLQTQWPSVDSEQRMVQKKSVEIKTGDKEIPSIKCVLPACFPPGTGLPKLPVKCGPEKSLVHNSQWENMPKTEMQIQTPEETEELLAEDRREGQPGMSECKKNQEARTEMNKETNVKTDDQECQVNVETSEGTTAVCPYPEHLYNVLFVGDSNVGKTSFLCRLHDNSFGTNMTATIGMDYRIKNLFVDNKCFALCLWDTAGQERYHSVTKQFFRKADGVVLMYDITSESSFADVRYWLSCIQEGAGNGVVILLLGNKTDCTACRRVPVEDGSYLAKEYGLSFYECSAASGHNVLESMVKFIRLLKAHEDELKKAVLELPAIPTKKRGCCT